MKKLITKFLILPVMVLCALPDRASPGPVDNEPDGSRTAVFTFIPGDDMFYDAWKGNEGQLSRLYALIDELHTGIRSDDIQIYVDSYTASMRDTKRNRELSFIRANRVKTELILRKGLTEDNFITKNHITAYDGLQDVVVVTVPLPVESEINIKFPEPTVCPEPQPVKEVEQDPVPDKDVPAKIVEPVSGVGPHLRSTRVYKGWYAGANIGLPFFWGDFLSTSADKTYIGFSGGIYGGYQFNSWLGVSLSLDYAYNKTGHRDYAAGYLLDPSGMTYYVAQSGTTKRYEELYGKINMFSAGLHADLNANRALGRRASQFPLKLIVSPAIYANTFSSNIYNLSDDKKYMTRDQSQSVSLGLGGDVMLRYDINRAWGVHLKGTGMWITDNGFDNIRTVGSVKQNAMWGVSAGVIWRIENKREK